MFTRKILTILALFLSFSLSIMFVTGQNTDSLPIITADNIQQLVPISTLESSYLGDLVWSDDGGWLALGTSHDGVQVFQASDLTAPPLILPAGTAVLFHPNSDYLASAGSLWEIESQTVLFNFGAVDYQQFSPDGELLFTARRDNEQIDFTLWHIATGNMLNSFTVDTAQEFKQIVFSDDASRYALVFRPYDRYANTGTPFIEVRNVADARLLLTVETTYSEVANLVFANDGQHLVFTNYDFAIYGSAPIEIVFWDIASQNILQIIDTYNNTLLSPDRKWLFVLNNSARDTYLIELDTREISYLPVADEVEIVTGLQPVFSSDGLYIAHSYFNSQEDFSQARLMLWRTDLVSDVQQSPIELFLEQGQGAGDIRSIDFSPDDTLVAVGYAQQIVIWDIASQSIRQIIEQGGEVRFTSASSNLLMIDNSLWDIETATLISQKELWRFGQFNPDRTLVASPSSDGLSIDNLLTDEEITLPILDNYLGRAVALDAENELVVFQDESFFVYDLVSEMPLLELDTVPFNYNISDDGSTIITQTQSQTEQNTTEVTHYDLLDNTVNDIQLNHIFSAFHPLGISPNGQYFAVIQSNTDTEIDNLFLYDAETGANLAHWQQNGNSRMKAIAFSTDNQYLLIARVVQSNGRFADLIITVCDVASLVTEETPSSFASLILIPHNAIIELDLNLTSDSSYLLVAMDDALLGDGVVHGYRVEVFDWNEILAIEGQLTEDELEHLILEGARNASFHPNLPVIVSDLWNMEVGQHDSFVRLWDNITGEFLLSLDNFKDANLSPDGDTLIALSTNPTSSGEMMVWRVDDLLNGITTPLTVIDSPDVTDIAFSADGQRIYQRTNYSVITLGIVP